MKVIIVITVNAVSYTHLNYGRMRKRGDQAAAWLCISEFVNAAIETGYHLNQMYQPFYKWKMWGMDAFHVLTDLKEKLTQLMQMLSLIHILFRHFCLGYF